MKTALFVLIAALCAFPVLAQTDSDDPVVVSRDEDSVKPPDVRETVGRKNGDEIRLPNQVNLPRKPETLEEKKKKMVFYLDLLTKTESRAETLRKSLFEMIEKENTVRSKIRNIEYSLRPEQIRNAAALSGSMRPELVREERVRLLNEEANNLRSLLNQITSNRARLEQSIVGADRLVDRVRRLFEYYVDSTIDNALKEIG